VKSFIRLMPLFIFACVATQAFAGDPPTSAPVAPPASADSATPVGPAAAPAKPERIVLDDKTLTNAEVHQLLAQGYKPQKGAGDTVLYCRKEEVVGTRFEKKVCMTADQIKMATQESRDEVERIQRDNPSPSGK
jgi:hypothetical protein